MDKKVSVSRFLQQARRAPTRNADGAKPKPQPQPLAGWPSSGRVSAALLLGLGLCAVAAVIANNLSPAPPAPPRHYDVPQSQGPAAWRDTPPSPAPDHTPVTDFRDQFESERPQRRDHHCCGLEPAKSAIRVHHIERQSVSDQRCGYSMQISRAERHRDGRCGSYGL